MAGVHDGIPLADLVDAALAHAVARGGRLEVQGSGILRSLVGAILRTAGVRRVANILDRDVYITRRQR